MSDREMIANILDDLVDILDTERLRANIEHDATLLALPDYMKVNKKNFQYAIEQSHKVGYTSGKADGFKLSLDVLRKLAEKLRA